MINSNFFIPFVHSFDEKIHVNIFGNTETRLLAIEPAGQLNSTVNDE